MLLPVNLMVRVLEINGSPRKRGNTYKLLKAALLASEKCGASAQILHVYDLRIEPCKG